LLYVLIRSIPWLGWVFGVVATLMGLGAIWLAFQSRRFTIVDQSTGEESPEQVEAVSPMAAEAETGEPIDQPVELAEPTEAVEPAELAEAAEQAADAADTEVGDREASLEVDQAPAQNEELQPPALAKD